MILISDLEVKSNFKYIWLKKVTGVDLNVHCARCLIGEYDERINSETKKAENLYLDNGIYYLCGVSDPYVWGNNFHLAFRNRNGENIDFSKHGISIKIKDAEILPIDIKYVDDTLPFSRLASFYSCRNWQFANFFKRYLE